MTRRFIFVSTLATLLLTGAILRMSATTTAAERETKEVASGYWLGVRCRPLTAEEKASTNLKSGLVVDEVIAKSPADKAGITKGDILVRMEDQKLKTTEELASLVATAADKKVSFQVVRDGAKQSIRIRLANRPADVEWPDSEDDAAKRKQLMDAAKRAIAQLQSAKAQEDAEKKEEDEKKDFSSKVKTPAETAIAGKKAESGEPIKQAGGASPLSTPTTFSENVRDTIQTNFLRSEPNGDEPRRIDPREQSAAATNELRQLEKRVDEIDRKLDEVLNLLKSDSRSAKKKK